MIKWLWIQLTGCSHEEISVKQDLGRTRIEECKRCNTKFYIQK